MHEIISSVFPLCGSWISNSGPQACGKSQCPLSHLTGPLEIVNSDTFLLFSIWYFALIIAQNHVSSNSLTNLEKKKIFLDRCFRGQLFCQLDECITSKHRVWLLPLCRWASQKTCNVACRNISFRTEVRIRSQDCLARTHRGPRTTAISQHLIL